MAFHCFYPTCSHPGDGSACVLSAMKCDIVLISVGSLSSLVLLTVRLELEVIQGTTHWGALISLKHTLAGA